jgi:RNA polymerase sigma-70 factor (ECF subfamily)
VVSVRTCLNCPHYVSAICDRPCAEPADVRCGAETERACGDRDIGSLFERHHRPVVAWACRITGSYELALDIAQDVFVKALTGIGRFRGAARVTTWLYSITRNCCRDHLKARACRPREVDDRVLLTAPPLVENDAIRSLEAQQAARLVRRLMRDAKLQATEARVFMWHHGYDLPLQAVTARLGLANRSGARASLVSATRKLRRATARWQHMTRAAAATRAPQGSMSP